MTVLVHRAGSMQIFTNFYQVDARRRGLKVGMHPVKLFRVTLLCTVVMLAVGQGAYFARAAAPSNLVLVSGADPYASCTVGADITPTASATPSVNYPDSEVEPSAAVNPLTAGTTHVNVIAAWQQDRWSTGSARGLVAGYSFDGGATWNETPLPFTRCAVPGSIYGRVSDPWISIGPDGIAYAAALSNFPAVAGSAHNSVQVATSHDGGRTWGSAVAIADDLTTRYFNDKESVTADPLHAGVAYVVWDRKRQTRAGSAPAMFSKTTDGGKTWSAPRVIMNPGQYAGTRGNILLVDAKHGSLANFFLWYEEMKVQTCHKVKVKGKTKKKYVCHLHHVPVHDPSFNNWIGMTKSTDGGATWSRAMKVRKVTDLPYSGLVPKIRSGYLLPSAAIDPVSGKIWVGWNEGGAGAASPNITVVSSMDGVSWSTPVHVESAVRPLFTPSIAVTGGWPRWPHVL